MLRRFAWLSCLALFLGLLAVHGLTAKDDKPPKPPATGGDAAPKNATARAEKVTLKATLTLKGTLEPETKVEVSVKPKAWSTPLVVEKAIEHGAIVKKGDVLVELDPEKIDRAIHELKMDRAIAAIALRQAEEELPVLEKNLPLDLASAERGQKHADEDLKKFLDVGRALAVETAENSLKNAQHYLEYAKEELKQLQKMYRDKDLTEETEEIILKRQRHQVAMAEFMLRTAKVRHDDTLKITLPRQEQTLRDAATKAAIAWNKARTTLLLAVNQKRLALKKLKYEDDKAQEKLANLEKDRELFTVKAPADGVVYYGKCNKGEWTSAALMRAKLRHGGTLPADEIFLTIVTPRPLLVHAAVDEKDLHLLHAPMKGRAIPTAYPDLKLPAELVKVSNVPESAGSFQALIRIRADKAEARLMPGMACTIKLTAFNKKDVLTIPAGAVFTDDDNEDEHDVYLAAKKGKPEKRPVKVGKTADGKTEVLGGLSEGDEVLTGKPS